MFIQIVPLLSKEVVPRVQASTARTSTHEALDVSCMCLQFIIVYFS